MKPFSLRMRLLKLIAIPLVIGLGGVAIASYFSAKLEAEEIYDAQLAHFARVLGLLTQHEIEEGDVSEKLIQLNKGTPSAPYEKNFAYRVWLKNDVILQSSNALPFGPRTQGEGFTDRKMGKELWRLFVLKEGDVTVEVAEDYHARIDLVEHVAISILLPFLFMVPVLFGAIWCGMRFGIAPLEAVSNNIRKQRPESLEPIQLPNIPQEISPVIESFNLLIKRVEQTLEREKRFTGYAAHELRTPLAALKTQVQVALRSKSLPEQKEMFADVLLGIDRMTHLVEQLLTLVRAQNLQQPMQPLHLQPLLQQSLEGIAAIILEKRLHVETSFEGDAVIQGNPEMLAILLRNILNNACRYSREGGLIEITQTLRDGNIYVTIRNETSTPFSEGDIENIFEPFYRMETEVAGTGLGLSIAKWIAKQHHIDIWGEVAGKEFSLKMKIPTLIQTL